MPTYAAPRLRGTEWTRPAQPRSIGIVVLAYNDAPALPRLIGELDEALQRLASSYEMIVVDDGSADDTGSVVRGLQRTYGTLRLVEHWSNQGVGRAFRSGMAAASADVVGYVDGDGQYVPADLELLLEALQRAGAASGVRVQRADGAWRNVVSLIYRRMIGTMYGVRLRDINSGIKLYRRDFLDLAGDVVSRGPFFDAEVIIKATSAGSTIVEVPVRHRPRVHGRAQGARFGSIFSALQGAGHPRMKPYVSCGYLAATLYAVVSGLIRIQRAGTRPEERNRAGKKKHQDALIP